MLKLMKINLLVQQRLLILSKKCVNLNTQNIVKNTKKKQISFKEKGFTNTKNYHLYQLVNSNSTCSRSFGFGFSTQSTTTIVQIYDQILQNLKHKIPLNISTATTNFTHQQKIKAIENFCQYLASYKEKFQQKENLINQIHKLTEDILHNRVQQSLQKTNQKEEDNKSKLFANLSLFKKYVSLGIDQKDSTSTYQLDQTRQKALQLRIIIKSISFLVNVVESLKLTSSSTKPNNNKNNQNHKHNILMISSNMIIQKKQYLLLLQQYFEMFNIKHLKANILQQLNKTFLQYSNIYEIRGYVVRKQFRFDWKDLIQTFLLKRDQYLFMDEQPVIRRVYKEYHLEFVQIILRQIHVYKQKAPLSSSTMRFITFEHCGTSLNQLLPHNMFNITDLFIIEPIYKSLIMGLLPNLSLGDHHQNNFYTQFNFQVRQFCNNLLFFNRFLMLQLYYLKDILRFIEVNYENIKLLILKQIQTYQQADSNTQSLSQSQPQRLQSLSLFCNMYYMIFFQRNNIPAKENNRVILRLKNNFQSLLNTVLMDVSKNMKIKQKDKKQKNMQRQQQQQFNGSQDNDDVSLSQVLFKAGILQINQILAYKILMVMVDFSLIKDIQFVHLITYQKDIKDIKDIEKQNNEDNENTPPTSTSTSTSSTIKQVSIVKKKSILDIVMFYSDSFEELKRFIDEKKMKFQQFLQNEQNDEYVMIKPFEIEQQDDVLEQMALRKMNKQITERKYQKIKEGTTNIQKSFNRIIQILEKQRYPGHFQQTIKSSASIKEISKFKTSAYLDQQILLKCFEHKRLSRISHQNFEKSTTQRILNVLSQNPTFLSWTQKYSAIQLYKFEISKEQIFQGWTSSWNYPYMCDIAIRKVNANNIPRYLYIKFTDNIISQGKSKIIKQDKYIRNNFLRLGDIQTLCENWDKQMQKLKGKDIIIFKNFDTIYFKFDSGINTINFIRKWVKEF